MTSSTQLLQVAGQGGFGRIGELAGTQLIRAPLQPSAEIVFVHAFERAPQFARCPRLRGRKLASRAAQLLGEARQVVSSPVGDR